MSAWNRLPKSIVPLDSIRQEEKIDMKKRQAEAKANEQKTAASPVISDYINNPPKTYKEKFLQTTEEKETFLEKYLENEDSFRRIDSCRASLHTPPQPPWKRVSLENYLKTLPNQFLYIELSPYWHDYTTTEYFIWQANDLWYCLWLDFTRCPSGGCDGQDEVLLIGVSPHDMLDQIPSYKTKKVIPSFLHERILHWFHLYAAEE